MFDGQRGDASFLELELNKLSASLASPHLDYKAFWNQVKELNVVIQSDRSIPRAQRDVLRARLDEICAEAKQRLKESAEQRERRQAISNNKRSLVEMKIREALGFAKAGRDADDLRKARELLQEALEWMKTGWGGFNATTQLFAFDDGKMTKSDHDSCWERWQEANRALDDRRRELGDYNFSRFESDAEEAIGVAEYDPKQAREKVH